MHRTRLSLAVAGHLDIPVGDPFGGAAYGKKEMPFIVGPAIGTLATAVTAGVAAAGGAMAVAGAVSGIAMVAGLAMTVVGLATGNEDLMKIGGYVGLAGGVGGLATSMMGAGTAVASTAVSAATPAANAGASTAATGGLAGATEAAKAAITPALSSVAPAAPAAFTATQAATGGTGLLGNAGALAITPALSGTGIGSNVGAGIGAGVGTGVGQSVNAASSYVPNQTGSFFDYLTSSQGLMEIGKVGAGALSGMAKQDQLDKQNKINQEAIDYSKMAAERQYQNANTQGRLSISTRPLTQAERDQAKMNQAARARRNAELLTQPAGA